MSRALLLAGALALLPAVASAQSAGEVERCFQNPSACPGYGGGGGGAAPAPAAPPPVAATARQAPAPDYATVLNSPEPERRKLQESLRILDKYNGPLDGNLQSEATVKAISAWQKGRGTAVTGKLTPPEAQALNAEAARVPIRRIDPSTQVATASAAPSAGTTQSNADALKALKARLAERRKAAEPKAEAATQALIRDLKAYVAAAGRGVAGDQFAAFAKWYAETKSSGRQFGDITPAIEDYGDAKAGAAATAEVNFKTLQGDTVFTDCLVFAWIEGNTRRNAQAFSCNDIAAVEKWKTDQALRSAWR